MDNGNNDNGYRIVYCCSLPGRISRNYKSELEPTAELPKLPQSEGVSLLPNDANLRSVEMRLLNSETFKVYGCNGESKTSNRRWSSKQPRNWCAVHFLFKDVAGMWTKQYQVFSSNSPHSLRIGKFQKKNSAILFLRFLCHLQKFEPWTHCLLQLFVSRSTPIECNVRVPPVSPNEHSSKNRT